MKSVIFFVLVITLTTFSMTALAADIQLPGFSIDIDGAQQNNEGVTTAIKLFIIMTVLSLAPSLIIMMTSFTRIIVVLSILRHAFGMQQTPPNSVLLSLAMFLTIFSMYPTITDIYQSAYIPYAQEEISERDALDHSLRPIKKFMVKQTREKDLRFMLELSGTEQPNSVDELPIVALIPAFMISELKTAFQIGFVIFLPFLLIDLIVAGVLMSMGMLMVPPMTIALPIKILMFVLIDGWNLVLKSLVASIM